MSTTSPGMGLIPTTENDINGFYAMAPPVFTAAGCGVIELLACNIYMTSALKYVERRINNGLASDLVKNI